jgi:alkylhydroperoxidase family enzyme
MTERKQRIPFRDFSTLSAEDREMGERTQVNGKVVNIFRVLMQHPKLVRAWSKFASYILSDGQTLAPRERELVILRIGWLNQAPYEWEQHVRIGKATGLIDDEIGRIGKRAEGRMEPTGCCPSTGRRRLIRKFRGIR